MKLKFFNHIKPQHLLVLIDIMGLLLLIMYERQNANKTILLFGLLLLFTIYLSNIILLKISSGDQYIFLITSMLVSIGVIMIYRIDPMMGIKQILWFIIGIVLFFFIYLFFSKKSLLYKFNSLYFYFTMSGLLFLITIVYGSKIKGSVNWIRFNHFSFQPSEIIKILFTLYLAKYYSEDKDRHNEYLFNEYLFNLSCYVYFVFLVIQKDLGTAAIFYLVYMSIIYIYSKNRKIVFLNIILGIVSAFTSIFVFDHVQRRIEAWINPWASINDKGYQITQSLFAISEGGFFGVGVGRGHPEFIPEVHTDFIFSAICEEMGVFVGISIIILFLILAYRGFKIALEQNILFYRIIALATTLFLGYQAFIIIGGTIKMIPLTGVTLPFVSYGGSSMVSSLASLALLQTASEDIELRECEDDEVRVKEDN